MIKKISFDKISLYDVFKMIQSEISKGFLLSNIAIHGYLLSNIAIHGYAGHARYYGELHFIKK